MLLSTRIYELRKPLANAASQTLRTMPKNVMDPEFDKCWRKYLVLDWASQTLLKLAKLCTRFEPEATLPLKRRYPKEG